MTGFQNIVTELTNICTKHASLGADKFFRFDHEYMQKMSSTDGLVMLMQPPKTYLRGTQNAIYRYYEIGFSILKPYLVGDYTTEVNNFDDTEEICMDIIARIRNYSTSIENLPTAFEYFDFESYIGQPILLDGDNRAGWDASFIIKEQVSLNWATGQLGKWTDHPII